MKISRSPNKTFFFEWGIVSSSSMDDLDSGWAKSFLFWDIKFKEVVRTGGSVDLAGDSSF